MSRYTNLFNLESIFKDGQIHENDYLFIHKSFAEDPSQFTLYGVTIDLVDTKVLLNFTFSALDDKVCGLMGPKSELPLSKLAKNILPQLFRILRQKMCPFSASFKRIRAWDSILYNVVLNSVFHNNSRATWRRLFTELVVHDLDTVPNFDGSNGIVIKINGAIIDMISVIQCGELQVIKDAVQRLSSLSNWASPANVTVQVLNGWSILHLAASTVLPVEIYTYLVDTLWCDVLRQDKHGRTALHVAAASLNYHAIRVLVAKCPTSIKNVDYNGSLPLHVLLQCISMRHWRKCIDSHHLQEAIELLVPNSNPGLIWESSATAILTRREDIDGVRLHDINQALVKENNFYRAVVHSDDHIAEAVVRIARRAPTTQWNLHVMREALYKCAARPWDRKTTVDLLFREIISKLVESELLGDEDLLDILDCSICSAVLGLRHTKRDRTMLKHLLERYTALMQTLSASTGNGEPSCRAAVFVYIAVLCGDLDLLSFVLAAMPRPWVKQQVYPPAARYSEEEYDSVERIKHEFDTSFKTRFRRFCNTLNPTTLDKVFGNTFSPLSLVCVLNRADAAHVLLRACYEVSAHQDSPSGKATALRSEQDHFHPLYWAVKSGASDCVRLIQNALSKDSLRNIYFHQPGPEKRSLFQEVLLCIGRDLPVSASKYPTSASVFSLGTPKGRAECLQLVLDSLPIDDKLRNAASGKCIGFLEDPMLPNHSLQAVLGLQSRLVLIDSALGAIQNGIANRTSGSAHTSVWEAPYLELQAEWASRKTATQKVIAELTSNFIQTNLRLMCKRFSPDKKWVKLAYCVHRLVHVLRLSSSYTVHNEPSCSPSPLSAGELPDTIDLTAWKAFMALINKASKTADAIKDFVGVLGEALRTVFSPHAFLCNSVHASIEEVEAYHDRLAVECATVERIWNDNHIFVMTRSKSQSPLPYGGGGDNSNNDTDVVPHYQINDFKPDQRDITTYVALQNWLVAMLRDVKARKDYKTRSLPVSSCTPNGEEGESVLEHLHRQQLLSERGRINALLSFADAPGRVVLSPISYLLFCASNTICTQSEALTRLREDLFDGGLSSTTKVRRRREEVDKNNRLKLLDKLLCVLVEFNAKLGGSAESLLSDVLPLGSLGLWRSAELIVDLAAPQCHHLGLPLYNIMQRLVIHDNEAFSTDAITRGVLGALASSANEPIASKSVFLLNPLHLAVIDRRETFIEKFLNAFADFPVDFASLLRFARDLNSVDIVRVLFAHCSGLQSQAIVQQLHRDVWSELDNNKENIRNSGEVIRAQFLSLIKSSADTAERLAVESRDAQIVLYLPFTLLHTKDDVHIEDSPLANSEVKLLNGSTVAWSELSNNPRLLALATPAPQRAGGLFRTGHNLLHQAALLPSPDLALCLLRNSSTWRDCICQADKDGCTPLFNALQIGHFQLVNEMLEHFENDVSMSKTKILSDLISRQSLPRHHPATSVRETIMQRASQDLLELENKFYIPRLRKLSSDRAGKSTPFYGLRDFDVKCPMDVLARCLQGIDVMWKKIIAYDPNLIMHVFQYPGCAQLDSVIRARQVIALLGVPLSQLAIPDSDIARKNHKPTHKGKDFCDLHPQKLKNLVPWPTAVQFRGIVCGWYRQRTNASPSQLDDTLFLFRNFDVSILDMGLCGSDVGKFLRLNSAYLRACDRVRVSGIQSNARAEVLSTLSEQLRMECRFDHASASRENMLRSGKFTAVDTSSTKVDVLLQSMQIDAVTCTGVLSLSYLILDFARALSVARQLIGVTAVTAARQQTVHPLDALHAQIANSRARAEQFRLILGLSETDDASLGEGVNARIRVCATTKSIDLQNFFRISSQTSARFSKLREFLVDGLTCLLLDQDLLQLGEFVCRQALRADSATSLGDASESESIPRVSSKFAKIVDSDLGFELVLRALQHFRVLDLISPKGQKLFQFARKNASRIEALLRSDGNEFCVSGEERDSFAKAEQPGFIIKESSHVLREVSSLAAKREQTRVIQEAAFSQEQSLRSGYTTAQVLFDLIATAIHLPQESSLYSEDVHQHIVNAHSKNPLIAVCLQGRISHNYKSS